MKSDRIRKLTGNEQLPDLPNAEKMAVLAFAKQHGRIWKARLSELWVRAAAEPTLHRLRNTHGPDWLRTLNLEELVNVSSDPDVEVSLNAGIEREVQGLRAQGFSRACICERSAEIEERVRQRLIVDDRRRQTGV